MKRETADVKRREIEAEKTLNNQYSTLNVQWKKSDGHLQHERKPADVKDREIYCECLNADWQDFQDGPRLEKVIEGYWSLSQEGRSWQITDNNVKRETADVKQAKD